MSTVEIKYLCTPHDGTPGEPWEKFEDELLDVAAGKTDDRGWSLADCFNQVDEESSRADDGCRSIAHHRVVAILGWLPY